jgi:hypothetical protein
MSGNAGCFKRGSIPKNFTDLTGRKFGRLLVISRAQNQPPLRITRWNVSCECGNSSTAWRTALQSGRTRSCGCLERESRNLPRKDRTHGEAHRNRVTAEYRTWLQMNRRCHDLKAVNYTRYGGRGIQVCAGWRTSYAAFLAHIGRKPTSTHTIDRIDNDGNYEPGNVRWATPKEQRANRRRAFKASE